MIDFVIGKLYLINNDKFYYIGKDDNKRDLFISKYTDKNALSNNYSIKFNGKNYADINSKLVKVEEIDDSDITDSSNDSVNDSVYNEIFSKKGSSTVNNSKINSENNSTVMSYSNSETHSDSDSETHSDTDSNSESDSD